MPIGAGVSSRRRVNWAVMRDMAIAWVLTLPAVGAVGYAMYLVTTISRVASWMIVLSVTAALAVWAGWLMSHAENAEDVAEFHDSRELHEAQ